MSANRITLATAMIFGTIGAAGVWGYYHLPHAPDNYVVTAKKRCLTNEGVSFTLRYSGRGEAGFLVVPPSTTTTTIPAKGKREAVK